MTADESASLQDLPGYASEHGSIEDGAGGFVMVELEADPSEGSENIDPALLRTPPPGAPAQDSPTSPNSSPPEPSDPEVFDSDLDVDENNPSSLPPRPATPTPSRLYTSSPLSPYGSRRALQLLTPQPVAPLSPTSPSGNKNAHQSNPNHYPKLRSKLRKDRERELLTQKGVMGKNKLEDRRIRERMITSLRKNLSQTIQPETRAAIKSLMQLVTMSKDRDPAWAARLEKFDWLDYCEMWRFQYLEIEELIQLKGWENTDMADPPAIHYAINYLRQQTGTPAGGKG
ncbi:hypothetical protein TWF696_003652 [Orbilia brochopaga]|uniref:Uncharacterized protein n=1 Tax=Orbilia brochopaga TaxID=3140254 RepID=A0AAV9V4F5_9PEZI